MRISIKILKTFPEAPHNLDTPTAEIVPEELNGFEIEEVKTILPHRIRFKLKRKKEKIEGM